MYPTFFTCNIINTSYLHHEAKYITIFVKKSMNKTTIISTIGIVALLLSQIYWLHNIYVNYINKTETKINNFFSTAIDTEMGTRWGSKPPKDPSNPKWIIKSADDMTPEERASLKGDTIEMNSASMKNIGKGLSDIFAQRIQDEFLAKNPIKLHILDSIFNSQLAKSDIHTSFQINLYDRDTLLVDFTNKQFSKKSNHITTLLNPIGTQGLLFAQANVEVPTSGIWRNMLASLIVSILIVVIVFGCLFYQLTVIQRTRLQLRLREKAVYSAIHDLKAPLNTAYTIVDFIALNEKDEKQLCLLENGKSRIRLLTEIIESMLSTTKQQVGTVKLNCSEVNVVELIEDVKKGLEILYPDKKYTFKLKNDYPHSFIYTDKVRLERCLRNLMENALKYSDQGVNVVASLAESHNQLSIAISDNGWGIPRQAQKKLGQQFYRVRQIGKEVQAGYGIGLCSVKLLLEEMGGKFTFQSTESQGSTFFIILPTL